MLVPNKTVSYEESILSKFPLVLKIIKSENSIAPNILYKQIAPEFKSINLFVQTMDCLFALGKITLNSETGKLELC